jgi:hypothetical protein
VVRDVKRTFDSASQCVFLSMLGALSEKERDDKHVEIVWGAGNSMNSIPVIEII